MFAVSAKKEIEYPFGSPKSWGLYDETGMRKRSLYGLKS